MTLLEIVYVAPVVVTVASALAALTPTKKDDEVVGTVGKVVNRFAKVVDLLALNVGHAKRRKE